MDLFRSSHPLARTPRGTPDRHQPARPDGLRPACRRRLRACTLSLAVLLVVGCANRGSLIGGSSSTEMKTSLSHLQFENEQLKTELAKLKEENRSIEDRLVQEQLHTGDLAARLDNARNLLRDRGIDSETKLGSRTPTGGIDSDDDLARPRTLPAGRSTRKPRKPPAAAIPGDLDAKLPSAPDDDGGTISFKAPGAARPRARAAEEPDLADGDEGHRDLIWQPVAQGDEPQAPSTRR